MSDLPFSDLKMLKLNSCSLNANRDMLLIDLMMELSHFMDYSLLHTYEQQIKARHLNK